MKFTIEHIEMLGQFVSEILFEKVGRTEVSIEDKTRYGLKEDGMIGFEKFFSKVEESQKRQ